ncbi:MAG: Adaptive-response sensory-kinase SasA [Myxococcota bacterium]|nr:Adaptive-response sensory-kinase SasA [Myxococcota bacterium]
MEVRTQSELLASIITLSIALSSLLRRPRPRLHQTFAWMNLALFAWFTSRFIYEVNVSREDDGTAFWFRLSMAAACVIPLASRPFLDSFLRSGSRPKTFGAAAYAASATLFLLAFSAWSAQPWFSAAVYVYVFGYFYTGMYRIYREYRGSSNQVEAVRRSYLAVGGLIAVTLSFLEYLPPVQETFAAFGELATVIYLYFLFQTLDHHRLLDLRGILGKFAVAAALAMTLAAIYWVLGQWGEESNRWFNTLVASLVILILFDPLRHFVEELSTRLFFKEKFELARTLERLRREMLSIIDPAVMTVRLLEHFTAARRVTQASVYLLEADGMSFRLAGSRGPKPVERMDVRLHRIFLDYLQNRKAAVLVELIERRMAELASLAAGERVAEEKTLSAARNAMADMHSHICIPFIGGERVLGFINLGAEHRGESFSTDELDLLLQIGDQAAIIIENSKLYERLKEKERLASLGEMAAGLAHEIRNPLGAIKGAIQLVDPRDIRGESQEFLNIIIEEINRLNTVVSQFLDYSRPFHPDRRDTDVNSVVSHVEKVLLAEGVQRGAKVRLDLDENLPLIKADDKQLTQVVLNLAKNGIEAMPNGGELVIETRSAGDRAPGRSSPDQDAGPSHVEILVHDTGMGIPREQLNKIFIPFFTTRKDGTGLGLAIVERIIKGHGGEIHVRSRQGEGTTFTIVLPVTAPGESTASAEPPAVPPLTDPGTMGSKPEEADNRTPDRPADNAFAGVDAPARPNG